MRFVIQRVASASVTVEDKIIGEIKQGLLVFIGVCEGDDEAIADKMIRKLIGLRIFEDEQGKTNLDLAGVGGSLLLVSQFTLYADCKKGNRPSFVRAGNPQMAESLYEYIIQKCTGQAAAVERGQFGADMKISLVNDGPFTICLDSEDL